jgi:FixJ family two-component response regulator
LSYIKRPGRSLRYIAVMFDSATSPGRSAAPGTIKSARAPVVGVVDDDPGVLESLGFLLETEGFDVRSFRSGKALLRVLDDTPAECFVIDYRMAGLDGLALSRRLHDRGTTAPIILITGDPDAAIGPRAAAEGICAVLLKPHLEESLLSHVRRLTRPGPDGDLR